MTFTFTLFITILIIFFWLLPTPKNDFPLSKNSFVINNVYIFDGQQMSEKTNLVVTKGIIKKINLPSLEKYKNYPIFDAEGGFLIPGLVDAHTHNWLDSLEQAVHYGITTQLDMFTSVDYYQQQQKLRNYYDDVQQADLFTAGILVTSPKGHGTEYGMKIPTIDNAQQADEFVAKLIQQGSDYIKIVYDAKPYDPIPFTSIDKKTLKAVIDAAHQQNKLAVVHVANLLSAKHAIAADCDGLIHSFGDALVDDEFVTKMKNNNVFLIPTLSVITSFANTGIQQNLLDEPNWGVNILPASRTALLQARSFTIPESYADIAIKNTHKMYQAGITLLAGTDAPNPGTAHGISLHGELQLLTQAGLSNLDSLRAATVNSMKVFNIDKRGLLKSNYKADMVLLAKNPLIDIKHSRTIKTVWKNGYIIKNHAEPTTKKINNQQGKSQIMANFEQGLKPDIGHLFTQTSDKMMQGNSIAQISHIQAGYNNSAGALHVETEVKPGFIYPWAGAFLMLSSDMKTAFDFTDNAKLNFFIKGKPGQYRLLIFGGSMANRPLEVVFQVTEQWSETSIDLVSVNDIDLKSILAFAWVSGPNSGSFWFDLDEITVH